MILVGMSGGLFVGGLVIGWWSGVDVIVGCVLS